MNGKADTLKNSLLYLFSKSSFMKIKCLLVLLLLCTLAATSQTTTQTVNGSTLEMQQDINGPLSLYWMTTDQEYRYFIKKDGDFTELTNTRTDRKYKQEYREQLSQLTNGNSLSTDKVNFTLSSLRKFINKYNASVDPNYEANSAVVKPVWRLGVFGGVTNNVFTRNPENISNPQLGADLEVLDDKALPRHSAVLQYKQTLSSDDFDFNSSQFSINYRFKFVKSEKIAVYVNTKLATITIFNSAAFETVIDGETVSFNEDSGTNFQGPFLFGLGADIALGKGFLTLNYHDAYSFFLTDNGEFPVDVSIGYKINL